MNILITGGAGFLGQGLARALLAAQQWGGSRISRLVLCDLCAPQAADVVADPRVAVVLGDLQACLPSLMKETWHVVFHLAAAVSAECEADFELGLHANLDGTRRLLDACRAQMLTGGPVPVVVFSSSVAVFGNDPAVALPPVVRDDTLPTPQSSYGIQKFIGEQLIADYTRKGFIDGRAVRLMTVSVRPGRPNGAASGFLSGLFREPLAGQASVCPVPVSTQVALSSPANTVAGLLAVAQASREAFGGRTAMNLPALSVSVQDMLTALEELAGPEVMRLIEYVPDATITRIVAGWPAQFELGRAARLGLKPDPSFKAVLQQYIAAHHAAITHPEARVRLGLNQMCI